MSFSWDLKDEIANNKTWRMRYKMSYAYGLFLYSKEFTQKAICLHTEHEQVALVYEWLIKSILGRSTKVAIKTKEQRSKVLYMISVAESADRLRLLELYGQNDNIINNTVISTPQDKAAFISGAYLACGNVTDPEKHYHLEFVVKKPDLTPPLTEILEQTIAGVKKTIRRKAEILYYKECAQLQDLTALMGASKSCLRIIDVEMIKNVRNHANRATNCETANIDKQVNAAANQIEDIELIAKNIGISTLPENLQQAAKLRLENPELSLRELSQMFVPPISRSGLHHRMVKIAQIAENLKKENKSHG